MKQFTAVELMAHRERLKNAKGLGKAILFFKFRKNILAKSPLVDHLYCMDLRKAELENSVKTYSRLLSESQARERKLGEELKAAQKGIKAAEKDKGATLGTIKALCHDLKSPTNPMLGYAELLLDEKDDETRKDYAKEIMNMVGIVQKMIKDTYDWVSSGKSELPLEIKLHYAAHDVLANFASEAKLRGIALVNSIGQEDRQTAFANEQLLSESMRNIISNAMKWVKNGEGKITVACSDMGGKWKISISNNGKQIPPDKVKTLFTPESAGIAGEKWQKGENFGLMHVKECVEKNGGEMLPVESTPDLTTFSFTLKKAAV
jgi:signal transduction histidine kinase